MSNKLEASLLNDKGAKEKKKIVFFLPFRVRHILWRTFIRLKHRKDSTKRVIERRNPPLPYAVVVKR